MNQGRDFGGNFCATFFCSRASRSINSFEEASSGSLWLGRCCDNMLSWTHNCYFTWNGAAGRLCCTQDGNSWYLSGVIGGNFIGGRWASLPLITLSDLATRSPEFWWSREFEWFWAGWGWLSWSNDWDLDIIPPSMAFLSRLSREFDFSMAFCWLSPSSRFWLLRRGEGTCKTFEETIRSSRSKCTCLCDEDLTRLPECGSITGRSRKSLRGKVGDLRNPSPPFILFISTLSRQSDDGDCRMKYWLMSKSVSGDRSCSWEAEDAIPRFMFEWLESVKE